MVKFGVILPAFGTKWDKRVLFSSIVGMIQKVNLPDSISGYVRLLSLLVGFAFVFFLFSLTTGDEIDVPESNPGSVEFLRARVLAEYPHDPRAFTQGLLWHHGSLYESTGQYGQSSLKKVELHSGDVLHEVRLSPRLFGEGLAKVGDRLIQLTWREEVALTYEVETFHELGRLNYSGEGWGLTYDGTSLVMSDGSDVLTFRDPKSFAVQRRLPITLKGRPMSLLNELEFADGSVYANIWQKRDIVRIEPLTGHVTAVIDASRLPYQSKEPSEDVLNGIAYIPGRRTFLLTGKLWPKIFEVRFE